VHPTASRRIPARRLAAALLTASAMLAALALPATAEDILQLDGVVTDTTGVLAGSEADIEAASNAAAAEGIQPFVLFVSTTDDRSAEEYAFETATANSLGVDDALILVALDDRTDFIWLSDGLDAITDEELDGIISEVLEPGLRDGDFPAATIRTIDALAEAAARPMRPRPRRPRRTRAAARAPTAASASGRSSRSASSAPAATSSGVDGARRGPFRRDPLRPVLRPRPPRSTCRPFRARRTPCSSRPTSGSATPARRSTSPKPSTAPMP
jgi:uncharacterized membrane protein YgcG